MLFIKYFGSYAKYVSRDMLCLCECMGLINEGCMNVQLGELNVMLECGWWNGILFMHCTNYN